MPTLDWIGKDKVINHHMDVPYRVLNPKYEYGEADGNMIIHGDNLSILTSDGMSSLSTYHIIFFHFCLITSSIVLLCCQGRSSVHFNLDSTVKQC